MSSWSRFFQGVGAGLAVAGVAFWVTGVVRKRAAMRQERDGIVRVDGARAADPVALSVRPPEEVASSEPLASEIPDFAPVSQRW